MQDQHIRQLSDYLRLTEVDLIVTSRAAEVLDDLTLYLLIETFVDIWQIVHVQGQRVGRIYVSSHVVASFAHFLRDNRSLESVSEQVFLA